MILHLKVHCLTCNNALQIYYILDHLSLLKCEKSMEGNQIHFLLSIHKTISCYKIKLSYLIDDNCIQDDCKKSKSQFTLCQPRLDLKELN